MPELIAEPSEWVVVVHRRVYAVIRCVTIAAEEYWRVVTGEADRSQRRLIGYWGSFEEASHNAFGYVERQLPTAWMGTNTATFRAPREMTPQKTPPTREAQIARGVDSVWGTPQRGGRVER